MRKPIAWMVLPLLSLTGCGSDGGGGVASTPTPTSATPTPTPTATPTPTPTNTTLTNLQYGQSFSSKPAGLLTSAARPSGTIGQSSPEFASTGALTIAYDPSSQGYTVTLGSYNSTFRPANRDTANSNAAQTAYSKVTGNLTENLALFNPGPGNTKLALTYASYGGVQRLVDNTSSITVSQDYFIFGIPTAATDLPRTGSATYQTVLDGSWASDGDLRALTGTSSFAADFASGTTSLRLVLGGTSVLNGSSRTLDTFTGTAPIDTTAATFTGALAPTASAYSGSFTGRFYGPAAAEAGATFSLTDGKGAVVAGAIVGRR